MLYRLSIHLQFTMDEAVAEDVDCAICKQDVTDEHDCVLCDRCKIWFHKDCLFLDQAQFILLVNSKDPWYCSRCLIIKANKIKWGEHEGEENLLGIINTIYNKILDWKKNIFFLPRGKSGTAFIKTLSHLIRCFVDKTKWERLSLPLVHIFVPLMLQRPSVNSKPKDNVRYLLSRLERWEKGDIMSIFNETNEVQKRMRKTLTNRETAKEKSFLRLMMFGKIGPAAKFINNDDKCERSAYTN